MRKLLTNLGKNVIILFIITQLSGCIPWPWFKVDYKGISTDKFNMRNFPSPKGEFSYLYVNNAFVNIFMRAHDETTTSGSPPYRVYVVVYGQNKVHKSFIIHSIKSYVKNERNFNLYPVEDYIESGKLIFNKKEFPIKKLFETLSDKNDYWSWSNIMTGNTISPITEKDEIVTVEADIEVFSENKSERKIIKCEFEPVRKFGLFRSLD